MRVEEIPFAELLSHVIDNRGRTCPVAESGIALIATNCIRNDILFPAYEKVRFVSSDIYETWFRGHPEPGDIIFVTKGSPGRVCLAPDPVDFCIAQDMVAVRSDKSKVYNKYLFAVLRSPEIQNRIEQLHVGSLIPHFKKGHFDRLFIPIPELEMQKYIGDLYYDLSLKIDLNRQINITLEALAQTLFKAWFVDFEPVKVKAAGLPPVGMDADTAALFPSAFVESELGSIPAGWEVSTIGAEARVVGGGTPSTKNPDFWENGTYHWATPKDLSNLNSPILLDTDRKITEAGLRQVSSGLLPPGTVLLSSRAPIGYLAFSEVPVAVNQGYITMVCEGRLPNSYVLLWAEQNMEAIKSRANGTTFLEVSKANFRPMPIIVPSQPILNAFREQVQPLYQRMSLNLHEARTLAQLRDTLLPRLLSGQLRVPVDEPDDAPPEKLLAACG